MSNLKIYKASAGSGKTYTLTEEYLKLLFESPSNYRHILAVTFTNKATAEMRSRILETLSNLSNREIENPEHLEELMKTTKKTEDEIRKESKKLLRALLHDYSQFSISTIDSFFQKVTRSFSQEIGLSTEFNLEFDSASIIEQAVDRLIFTMDLPENREIKDWLINFALEQIEDEKGWNISWAIEELAKQTLKEEFQIAKKKISGKDEFKVILKNYKTELNKIVKTKEEEIIKLAQEVLDKIESNGVVLKDDFAGKSRGPMMIFQDLATIDIKQAISKNTFLRRVNTIFEGAESIQHKSIDNEAIVTHLYNTVIIPNLKNITVLLLDYTTAAVIFPDLNSLGLIDDLDEKIKEVSKEKNIFLLSNTNYLINQIIDSNEAPFIYEKIGTRYEHFMIDEFQDTSTLQYKNFLPLVENSLSSGKESLFVGDVKQAIYRWRNSDWNLLASQVNKDFAKYNIIEPPLATNWRSSKDIVEFNNEFFKSTSQFLQDRIVEDIGNIDESDDYEELKTKITNAYSNLEQKVAPKNINNRGYVSIQYSGTKPEENEESNISLVIEEIEKLLEAGFDYSDIAILVRTNNEGTIISNALLAHEKRYPVISNISLILNNSIAVQLIVAQLEFIIKPYDFVLENFIRLYQLSDIFTDEQIDGPFNLSNNFTNEEVNKKWEEYKTELFDLQKKPLYDLVEAIINKLPDYIYNKNREYIKAFLSKVLDYINTETSDISQFLNYWDIQKKDTALTLPENQNAIKILSVHKSKGLEFEAVIIPFLDWGLSKTSKIWVSPTIEPYNKIGYLPISGGENLLNLSHFKKEYLTEKTSSITDTLNVCYVAFTRAKTSLSLIIKEHKEKSKSVNYSTVIDDFIKTYISNPAIESKVNQETKNIEIGKLEKREKKREEETLQTDRISETIEIAEYRHTPIQGRIINHIESKEYFSQSEEEKEAISYGRLMHEVFEKIKTKDDINKAVTELKISGKISSFEIDNFMNLITEKLNNPKIQKWFDGAYRVKTETDIIASNIRRPDRVMISDEEILVVDYKFGVTKNDKNIKQVEEYLRLIHQIESKKVRGFVWYINLNEIDEVLIEKTLF